MEADKAGAHPNRGDRLVARIVSNIVRISVSRVDSKIRDKQAIRNIRGFDG